MKAKRIVIWLAISVCLSLFIWSLFFADFDSRRVTVQHLRTTIDNAGVQYAFFTLSNPTDEPVIFIGNSDGLPIYNLYESIILNSNSPSVSVTKTNHNSQERPAGRYANLPPESGIDFVVTIPNGVTNATLRLDLPGLKRSPFEKIERAYRRLRKLPVTRWPAIEIKQPFEESNLLPHDE